LVSEGQGQQEERGGSSFGGLPPGRADNFQGLTVGFGKGSIPQRDAPRKAPEGIDSVFHLADRGRVPEEWRVWLSEKRSRRVYPWLIIWPPIHASPIPSFLRFNYRFEGCCGGG
jgi:hypothetical protein